MSEFDYSKCSKPFGSRAEAREFMRARDFEGWILARADGTFTAVCPTYPDGYHPDAVVVEAIPEGSMPMAPSSAGAAPPARSQDVDPTDEACCAA